MLKKYSLGVILKHTLAFRRSYFLENPREQQNHDTRSEDLMGKMGLREP
jgi:hypothetical protein